MVSWEGRLVKTKSGSVYALGKINEELLRTLETFNVSFDADQPLDNLQALCYTSNLVFSAKLREKGRNCLKALYELQEILGFKELTEPHFQRIIDVLSQMGIQ